MTTGTAAPRPDAAAAPRVLTFVRLLRSELTKLRTVRSTIWAFVLLVVLTIGFTVLITAVISASWSNNQPSDRASIRLDPTAVILGSGFQLGQLTICVLGVLVISSEYSTGMIRASLLAVPRRLPMLAAKALVFFAVVLVIGEIVAFVTFFVGSAILHSHAPVSIGDPGVLRAVIGGGLYLAVLGVFSMAIGAILRSTAAAVTVVIGLVLVVEPLTQLLPGNLGKYVHAYLPSPAGQLIAQSQRQSGDVLSPWEGFGVFCLWTAVLLTVAAILLDRRDA